MLRLVGIGLALAALGAALLAAWKWRQGSQSGQLSSYGSAAICTAVCVVLAALSSVAVAFAPGALAPRAILASAPIAPPTETAPAPSPRPAGGAFSAMRQACSADFQKSCPDAKPGNGALAACIKQNQDSFSDPCKTAIAQMRANWQAQSGPRAAMRQACLVDFQAFCPDAKPGPGGAIAACIKQNHDSFSDPCKTAIAQMRAQRQEQPQNAGPDPDP